jgi:Mn-dependent DtxR family transcriptional regulator
MNTQPSSVNDVVQKLAYKKVLSYQQYKGTSLTKKGNISFGKFF